MDADGFLSITDRKKELLKTSGGKLIAPQPIENKLKAHSAGGQRGAGGGQAQVCVRADLAELRNSGELGQGQGRLILADRKGAGAGAKVVARYQRIVDEVNATLAPYETIKRIALVADEWSVETDELTPSMKLKRRVVEKKYAAETGGVLQGRGHRWHILRDYIGAISAAVDLVQPGTFQVVECGEFRRE
jgi:long-chain acyl-CoA synthetase